MGSCLCKQSIEPPYRSNKAAYYPINDNRIRMEKIPGLHRPVARLNV